MTSSVSPEKYDIFKVASASPQVAVGSPELNVGSILEELDKPVLRDARFIVLPELAITGYTCADLFFQQSLIESAEKALVKLCEALAKDDRLIAVGIPLIFEGRLYNCAAVLTGGRILGVVPKVNIPNYQEFYEKRWFASGVDILDRTVSVQGNSVPFGRNLIFSHCGVKVGIEICEDLWVANPPSSSLCMAGAEIILNLSATDDNIGKYDYIRKLVASQSGRCRCCYAYSSAGKGESSTDLVFSGINLIASDGSMLAQSERFLPEAKSVSAWIDVEKLRHERRKYSTFYPDSDSTVGSIRVISSSLPADAKAIPVAGLNIDPAPFVPSERRKRNENCSEIIEIQTWGLSQRLRATGCRSLVVGISGGLDSTLALLVAHHTFLRMGLDPKGITGVTMPAEATSSRTRTNALKLMDKLGVTSLEIPVRKAVTQHFADIGHDESVHDAVYENSQARERTQILMDLANGRNGMVLGTGDMSELALGWCTYNGDQMSMYNVNGGVPKTLVKYLVGWFADNTPDASLKATLLDIIDTPISPELVPSKDEEEIAQKTEELIGPYELHDFFLFHVLRNGFTPSKIFWMASMAFDGKYSCAEIKKWLVNFYRRFFSQQFKRSCMPDGPKVGSVCLSPRGDWRMPSDASGRLWIEEAQNLSI